MQGYNIFFPIHKGLRAMLYETALMLQQTDFTESEEAQQTIVSVKNVVAMFDKHAHTEDNFVFPAITAYEPSIVTAFEQEHIEDHALGQMLENLLLGYEAAESITEKQAAGEKLTKGFIQFLNFNLQHMAKEEEIINGLLWKYYTDADLHNITQEILKSIEPSTMMEYSKWMVRGMNNLEIAEWLKEVKKNAPQPVFNALINIAGQELHPQRWNLITECITEGAMVI